MGFLLFWGVSGVWGQTPGVTVFTVAQAGD
ncbi:MAG: hypothetical protein RL648_711, partial [Verrucomicrobiota bacterium]